MKTHTMKLCPESFEKIIEGIKSLKLRLYDKKWKEIEVGDEIIFLKDPEHKESIVVEVIGLMRYVLFSDLLKYFSPNIYLGHINKADALAGVSAFYSKEDQVKNCILGIRFKLS